MNATDIVSGEIYACTNYISKNRAYYSDAYPVKAVWKFPERLYGRSRDTWMVEVIVLEDDEDLTHRTTSTGADLTKNVRARDLYTRWEDHVGERELRRLKREEEDREYAERRRQQQLEYEQRERERQERIKRENEEREAQRLREEAEKERLLKYLAMKGISPDCVVSVVNGTITLDRVKTQRALGMK